RAPLLASTCGRPGGSAGLRSSRPRSSSSGRLRARRTVVADARSWRRPSRPTSVAAASPARIRFLIVDDQAMVRRGMRDFLDLHDDLEVVGEAANGLEALAQTAALLPDVVVMDLLMPDLDGIAATAQLKKLHPAIEVVVITSFIEEDRITAALEAGASGFLLKDAEADDLGAGILSAGAGEVYLDPAVAGIVARRMRTGPDSRNGGAEAVGRLTARERDVRAGVARGRSNRAIADELGIAERTARTHVSNILAKLGLTSRTQAALFAIEHHLDRAP